MSAQLVGDHPVDHSNSFRYFLEGKKKKKPSKFFEMEELSASKNTYVGDGESWRQPAWKL
jgi:hypothetical protein